MGQIHDYDKILTRLTIILQRLHEGEVLSVQDLALEFNVSTKTIQRDFNQRLIRFPIEKKGAKWTMQLGHAITKERSPEEALVLEMLGNIAEGIGSEFGVKAKSLFSKLQNNTKNPIYIARPGCIPSSERREVTFRDIENTHKLPNMAIVDENIILMEHDKFIALPFDKATKILKRVALEKFIDTDEMDRASTFDLNCSKCGGNYMLYNKGSSTVLKCSKCHDTKYIGRSEALLIKDLYKLSCPDCNADVTPRQKKGHSDYSFFGCLNYPHCNGSIHMYSVAKGY